MDNKFVKTCNKTSNTSVILVQNMTIHWLITNKLFYFFGILVKFLDDAIKMEIDSPPDLSYELLYSR